MALKSFDWEKPLLSLAYEAAHSVKSENITRTQDEDLLKLAYAHCESVTAQHSRSFFLASRLLPAEKRRAIRALYAFCRTTDDIVDHPVGDAETALRQWRRRALPWSPPNDDLVTMAWADTCANYQMPQLYAEHFFDGVARDLYQKRYDTFEELALYCYGVASTVGLMSMHITGYCGERAIKYAVRLGVALQLTNILRDVAEDWRRGRLYLPQEELDAFGVQETDIKRGVVTEQWRAFLKYQITRARRLYAAAWPGMARLAPEGRLAIAAAADFYSAILNDIEAHDYDVFGRRAHLTGWEKMRRLPRLWWRTRQLGRRRAGSLAPRRQWMPGLDG